MTDGGGSMSATYTFKPFVFTKHSVNGPERPKARSGHRIACDHRNLYSYGGFNPCISDNDPDMRDDQTWIASKPLFKELWRYNLVTKRWKRLPGQENMPNELASNAVILCGNALMVYGGTGVPFGESCSNQLYICNVDDGAIQVVPAIGELPLPQYGQALVCHGPYLYTVGGTTGYEYTCDIHRFDLRTGVWEVVYICSGRDEFEPYGRYRHELAFDGNKIYVLGGGTSIEAYGFSEIPAFDLRTNRWTILYTHGDTDKTRVPAPRRCHGSVQYTDEKTGVTSVVISGGYNGDRVFSDVWRLDLSTLQWTRMRKCVLPSPVYFHSAALTPEGRMYLFGGIVKTNNKVKRTNAIYSAWITIPKLSEICWQALNYYYRDLRNASPDKLLSMGIPLKFVQRLDSYDR
ncbi:PREDICTED: kelch domain-containing protein 10 homolog [Wasmannia auropunctata]|uniref:kelch domain-containing protein 10 homolog n=1 Tax=Wasmannia auropunctata TaxID=64793 RepID=UPI0005EE6C7C|nr:PREDICTED: kelch domain-containing protein 10 homolog [Wasmannia auropunctata]XP_011691614.1 PREDICTED: kelch domain-containing protein 10 homolog [Wasmannia auropunctata]XP_011691615.1 PREDICTED: kelch domain-containing protein 10 homolog [Wasmannia auropunctata]